VACTQSGGRVSVTLSKFEDNWWKTSSAISANKSYFIRVAAQQGDEPGRPGQQARASEYGSAYTKATTKGWPFDPPSNIVSTARTSSSITMKWDPAPTTKGDVRYRLQVAKKSDMSGAKTYPVSAVNASSLKITGLSQETTYYVRVRVVDPTNTKMYSDYSGNEGDPLPSTARTTSPRGSLEGSFTAGGTGCSPSDYRMLAYWGDEVVQSTEPRSVNGSTGTFRIDNLRTGGYYVQYSYIGVGNCVTSWVSNASSPSDESHMLRDTGRKYWVEENKTEALPPTTGMGGVVVRGTTRDAGGGPVSQATVTAIGAPANGANLYREVHDIAMTGADGTFELRGLWPGKKYKFYVTATAPGLTGKTIASTLWVDHVSASDPGTSYEPVLK